MKYVTAVSLAAVLALATVPGAQAFGIGPSGVPSNVLEQRYFPTDYVPHHECHGMISGTAHPDCGTDTGGPVGGLF